MDTLAIRLGLACLLVCGGCGAESGEPPSFATGACTQHGVLDPVAVPDRCGIDIAGDGEDLRVFAIGPVIRYAEMEDYATFCKAWDDVVRTEVLPCLADDKPNLLVFPENATLAGAFIGSRGASGRQATVALPAFLALLEAYDEPVRYYARKFPETSPSERLVLALTDTLLRAYEVFPEIAKRYGVHVAVSSDFARARLSTDPSDVAALADPDLEEVTSVYVATESAASNWGIYLTDEGNEIARVAKSYLVPDEETLLDLRYGPLTEMRPVQLPFARSGMVISKDAWMPGLLHRLDALGADLMLQPEAFSGGWSTPEFEGEWRPDILRESGWAHTQRHGSFRHTVVPCIKGNLTDLIVDGQSHITHSSTPDDPLLAMIGQDPYRGMLTVEPWVIPDPGPPWSLEERRAVLRERGEKMAPDSGDPLEDQYEDHVIAADLWLPADGSVPPTGDGVPGALGASALVAPPTDGTSLQRFPALAADDDTALVAFMEGAPGRERVRAFWTDAQGDLVEIDIATPEGVVQRLPRVAIAAGRAAITWEEERADGTSTIVASTHRDGLWRRTEVTASEGVSAWEPDVAIDPGTGRFYVTWLDLRTGGRPKPWIAHGEDGETWQALAVDPGNPIDDNPRGDAAFVRVEARDEQVFVAFADFREFSWDVYLSTSDDAGATFGNAVRINPPALDVMPVRGGGPIESERIHGDVALAVSATGEPIVAWTERQDRRYESHVRMWSGGETVRGDDAPPVVDAWRPALAASRSGNLLVAWQDLRDGTNRVRVAEIDPSSFAPGPSALLDDAAPGTHLYGPKVAFLGEAPVAVWEDVRSGFARVRMTPRRPAVVGTGGIEPPTPTVSR